MANIRDKTYYAIRNARDVIAGSLARNHSLEAIKHDQAVAILDLCDDYLNQVDREVRQAYFDEKAKKANEGEN